MSPPDFDRHRRDPSHWILGFIYFAPADPRILVPKRLWALGFTLNFARPMAIPALLATLLAGCLIRWAMMRFELLPHVVAVILEAIVGLAVIGACVWLAGKRRATSALRPPSKVDGNLKC